MKMQCLAATRLAMIQTQKLFSIAEHQLNLETRFVVADDGLGIQREVG